MDDTDPAAVGAGLLEGFAGRRSHMCRQAYGRAVAEAGAEVAAGRDPAGATRAAMLGLCLRSMRDRHSDADAHRMLALRCAQIGTALAARDLDAVAPHELAACLAALALAAPGLRDALADDLPPPRPRPCPPARATLPTVVPFASPWRDGRNAWRLGRGLCTLPDTPAGDVSRRARLSTPAGAFDAVLVGGTWLRPLFAPGSWDPVSVDAFAEAVADGRAWADNPFVPWARPDRVLAPLASVTLPGQQAQRDDARRVAEGEAAALARAGALRVVGGVVHRPSTEPVVTLAMPADRREALPAFAWVMDRLHWGAAMGTLDPAGPRWDMRGVPIAMPGTPGTRMRHVVSFPLGRLGDAVATCAFMARAGMAGGGIPVSTEGGAAAHDPPACLGEAASILQAQARLDGASLAAALRSGGPGSPGFAEAVREAASGMSIGRGAPGDTAQCLAAALASAAVEGLARVDAGRADDSGAMGAFVP